MSYGPAPWQQTSWDFRAALNFMCGGSGAGLLIAAAISSLPSAALRAAIVLGLALIGIGLASVWFEIGRPLRAINVSFNPFTSWMTRESFAAVVVFLLGLVTAWLASGALAHATALAALGFVYCQGRILRAASGIPAWREPAVVWLTVTTALAEGAGLFIALAAVLGPPSNAVIGFFTLALIARGLAWSTYRAGVARHAAGAALAALDRAGKILLQFGTLAPLALLILGMLSEEIARIAATLAGAAALVAGSLFKFILITRAAYNQGFALPRLPVRGSR